MPAIKSSATIPMPPGSASSERTGQGFQMSNKRKSKKAASHDLTLSVLALAKASHSPSTSSTTTTLGSFRLLSRAVVPADQMAGPSITSTSNTKYGGRQDA